MQQVPPAILERFKKLMDNKYLEDMIEAGFVKISFLSKEIELHPGW